LHHREPFRLYRDGEVSVGRGDLNGKYDQRRVRRRRARASDGEIILTGCRRIGVDSKGRNPTRLHHCGRESAGRSRGLTRHGERDILIITNGLDRRDGDRTLAPLLDRDGPGRRGNGEIVQRRRIPERRPARNGERHDSNCCEILVIAPHVWLPPGKQRGNTRNCEIIATTA